MNEADKKGRVIICGTGRAGTSFLVRLLTHLGYDTGYSVEQDGFIDSIRAGCELRADGWSSPKVWEKLPEIVKSPFLSLWLTPVPVPIRWVFIPIRDLDEVTSSREAAGLDWPQKKMDQRDFLAKVVGEAVVSCMTKKIPFQLLQFPRHIVDSAYCRKALSLAFPEIADDPRFDEIHQKLAAARVVPSTAEQHTKTETEKSE